MKERFILFYDLNFPSCFLSMNLLILFHLLLISGDLSSTLQRFKWKLALESRLDNISKRTSYIAEPVFPELAFHWCSNITIASDKINPMAFTCQPLIGVAR